MVNKYNVKISPEVILNKYLKVPYTGDSYYDEYSYEECCEIILTGNTINPTGFATYQPPFSTILSGGTNGSSLLTGLTIPILITEDYNDLGHYSVFDGAVLQSDVITNFLFSGNTTTPNTYYVYNTSDVALKNYLTNFEFILDWGDGSPTEILDHIAPNYKQHVYPQNGKYTITLSGSSPFGVSVVKKDVVVPYSNVIIDNPNGQATFYPGNGNWSGTPVSYDYIFSGDSDCDVDLHISSGYTQVPFLVTGYTVSTINDLSVYGNKSLLYAGKFRPGEQVTGTTGVVGTFWGPDVNNTYTGYTINEIDYYDYPDGTTVFAVYSSGFTANDLVCEPMVKEEFLIGVYDQPEVQSDIFIERGKYSALEPIQRLNEVYNMGTLTSYGYGFFKINKV